MTEDGEVKTCYVTTKLKKKTEWIQLAQNTEKKMVGFCDEGNEH